MALFPNQILLHPGPYNCHPPFEVVVTGIVVAGTTVGSSYTGTYSKTGVPSKTAAEMGIAVQPKTGEDPGIEVESVQSLISLLPS